MKNVIALMLFVLASPVHAEWTQQDSGTTADLVDVCFVDELHGWAIGNDGSTPVIIATTDGGVTWVQQTWPIEPERLNRICFVTQDIGFIACERFSKTNENLSTHIVRTTDGGETWEVSYTAPPYYEFNDITFIDENTGWVAGGVHGHYADEQEPFGGVVLLTKDGGDTWTEQLHVTYDDAYIDAFVAIDFADEEHGWMMGFNEFTIASGQPTNVYYTSNGGENWVALDELPGANAERLYAVKPDTLWTTHGDTMNSFNGGVSWDLKEFTFDLGIVSGTTFWATKYEGICFTEDAGATWSVQSPVMHYKICAVGDHFACAVSLDGVVSTYAHGSSYVENSQPDIFTLEPNYPNPFNASTTIAYSLTEDSPVRISLFTATGQRVRTLCERSMSAGRHSIVVDGSDLASGLYVARMEAQGVAKYTRMLLLK